MGLRQDKRSVRVGSTGRDRKYEHCARDHAQKHGLLAANHCARWRTRRSHNVIPVPELQQFPSGRLRLVGSLGKNHKVVVRNLWRKLRLANGLLVVQTGESVNQAKVFKAHAVPQGSCAVKNWSKECRKGLTIGLRDFIEVDNDCVVGVGSLSRGREHFKFGSRKLRKGVRM